MAIKSLSVRIDDEILDKLHVVADYEGRSANSQIVYLIRKCIQSFEAEHGKIFEEKPQNILCGKKAAAQGMKPAQPLFL